MNIGILEAESLAAKLWQAIQDETALTALERYNQERSKEWRSLLGMSGGLQPGSTTSPWVTERCHRILSCIPGSGEDLTRLAGQLGLTIAK